MMALIFINELLAGLAILLFSGGIALALILLACVSKEKGHHKNKKDKR